MSTDAAAPSEELRALRLALETEAQRYRALFEGAPIAYFTTDDHGKILEANTAAAEILGVTVTYLVGKPLPLYADLAERRAFRLRLRDIGRVGGTSEFRARMRRSGGSTFDALVHVTAGGGEIRWMIRDVTEERQAEHRLWELNRELEERAASRAGELESVLEQLPVGVVIVDDRYTVRRANRRAVEILGEAMAIGGTISFETFRRFRADGRSLAPEDWPVTRALAGEHVTHELLTFELDGSGRPTLEISAQPVNAADGRVTGAVVTLDDVTRRERRERAEREFVTNATHELRTPLTAIATAVEVLQSGAKEIPSERDLFLGHVERECARLSRLGTALLSLARAQSETEAPLTEVVRLRDVLKRVAADLRVADDVEVTVACARDVAAVTNRDLVEQAVWNAATNAARYTAHGEVALTAELRDGLAVVEIRDTGPGIPAEARSRLFDRFYRAGARDAGGFGLGLSIAKQSVEAVGGTMAVESEPGAGTTARIALPAAKML